MSESSARSRIFAMAWSLSGKRRSWKSAYGTNRYSAWPPVQSPRLKPYAAQATLGFVVSQTSVRRALQLRHRPQATLNGTETRSPSLRNSTSGPTSMTSPVISCPIAMPWGTGKDPR